MQRAIDHLTASDPVLARIIERVGPCGIQYHEPTFRALARSIVFQQLNGKAATSIFNRLEAATPRQAVTPEAILRLGVDGMRPLGISAQKGSYLYDLAEKTQSGLVDFMAFPAMTDSEVIVSLRQVKGVGEWTAHMFLIFALQRPDILPTGDLGVRMAMKQAYRMRALPKPERMVRVAKPWRPFASYAAWYLWRSLEGVAEP